MRCNSLHLGRRGSATAQCLLFLEGRFGEDTHSACRYLGARTQYLLSLEGRFAEDMVPVLLRCNPLRLGRKGPAKAQYLFFLEGRFGEDTHNACRYLGARTQYLLFVEGRFGEDMVPVLMRREDTIPPFFRRTIRRGHGPCAYDVRRHNTFFF